VQPNQNKIVPGSASTEWHFDSCRHSHRGNQLQESEKPARIIQLSVHTNLRRAFFVHSSLGLLKNLLNYAGEVFAFVGSYAINMPVSNFPAIDSSTLFIDTL
jgi:hypothetical protein